MPMYNLTEFSDNCLDTLGRLWQINNADSAVDNNGIFNSHSFISQIKSISSRKTIR